MRDDGGTKGDAAARQPRLAAIDVARGTALCLMAGYHFSWDLDYFRLAAIDLFGSPFWLAARWFILVCFLFLVGVSLVLGHGNGLRWRPYLRRLAALVVCAGLITAASYAIFPNGFIFFGALHAIAVGSLLGLLFLRLPAPLIAVVAAACVASPSGLSQPLFNHPALWWVGLSTVEPNTVDYVPLLPWFGWILAGMAAARWAVGGRAWKRLAGWSPGAVGRGLALAGRHGLAFYMLHQPLLFGLLYGVVAVIGWGTGGGR